MYTLFTILIVAAAILLILLVLVQNSKGGGLASGFSSGNAVLGAPKTTDFLEKASWSLAGLIVLLAIFAVGLSKGSDEPAEEKSAISEQVQNAQPVAPVSAPAEADFNAEQADQAE